MRYAAFEWLVSKTSGVALVSLSDEERGYDEWRQKPKAPDVRAWLALSLADAFDDGWYSAVSHIFAAFPRKTDPRRDIVGAAHATFRPDYAHIRNVLWDDFGFDYLLACIVAMRVTSRFNPL